ANAFVADESVSQTPPASEIGPVHDTDALQAALANIEDLVSGEAVPVPTSLQGQVAAPVQYPSSVADWTDQMLASVDDFAAVLLALRAGKPEVTAVSDTAK